MTELIDRLFLLCVLLFVSSFGWAINTAKLPHCSYSFAQLNMREVEVPSDLHAILNERYSNADFTPILATERLLLVKIGISGGVAALDRNTFELVGYLGYSLDWGSAGRVAQLPVAVFNKGQGIGTEMKYGLMKYAFEKESVDEVIANIFHNNMASIALHEKLGFIKDEQKSSDLVFHYSVFKNDFLRMDEERRIKGDYKAFFFPRRKLMPIQKLRVSRKATQR